MKLGSGMPLYRACGQEESSVVNKELVSKNKHSTIRQSSHQEPVQSLFVQGSHRFAQVSECGSICHIWETKRSTDSEKLQHLYKDARPKISATITLTGESGKGLRTHLTAGWCSQRWPRGRRGTARGRCSCGRPGCWGGGDTGSCWDDHAATATCSSLLCALSCGFLSEKGENSTVTWFS